MGPGILKTEQWIRHRLLDPKQNLRDVLGPHGPRLLTHVGGRLTVVQGQSPAQAPEPKDNH